MAALPSSSSIPGALSNLLSIAVAALPSGTTVWYGTDLPAYITPLTFSVTEITGDQKVAELGTQYRREETFNLVSSLAVYQGGAPNPVGQGPGFVDLLTSLMASFDLLSSAIGNNPTLNGAVRFAEVGNFVISAQVDNNGQSATVLDFNVRCQQRVLSLS